MDTISLQSTTTPANYGILQPQVTRELRTISNVIVHYPRNNHPNNNQNHKSCIEIVHQQINTRTYINTSNFLQTNPFLQQIPKTTPSTTPPFSLPSTIVSSLNEINFHYENIEFFKQSKYFNTSVGQYYTPEYGIIFIYGRPPCDPFQSQRREDITVVTAITNNLSYVKIDHTNINVKFEPINQLEYYNERLKYLKKYKDSFKYSTRLFGNDYNINTQNGSVIVSPQILHNTSIKQVIESLDNSFKLSELSNNQQLQVKQVSNNYNVFDNNTVNVITGVNSSIYENATDPIDRGPDQDHSDLILGDTIELPVEYSPASQSTQDRTWQDYDFDEDYYESTPQYKTPFDVLNSDALYRAPINSDEYYSDESGNQQSTPSNDIRMDIIDDGDQLLTGSRLQRTNVSSFDREDFDEKCESICQNNKTFRSQDFGVFTPKQLKQYISSQQYSTQSPRLITNTESFDQSNDNKNRTRPAKVVLSEQAPEIDISDIHTAKQYYDFVGSFADTTPVSGSDHNYDDMVRYNHTESSSFEDDDFDIDNSTSTYQRDLNIVMSRIDELFDYNANDTSDEDTPELFDEPQQFIDDEINDEDAEQEILYINDINTLQSIKFIDTSLLFDMLQIGKGKEFISGASGYPPTVELNIDSIAACQASYTCENIIDISNDQNSTSIELETQPLFTIQPPKDHSILTFAAKQSETKTHALFTDHIKAYQNIDHSKVKTIDTKCLKWFIKVPVLLDNGTILQVSMMADTGANHPCVNYNWAYKYFKDYIDEVSKHNTILTTASEKLQPKYSLHLVFPLPNGKFLKTKFYLIENLPCTILADINMLLQFGYKFKYEKPNIFKHNEKQDENLNIKTFEDSHKIHQPVLSNISIAPQTALEEIDELCESIIVADKTPMLNKSNQPTVPSILCTSLQEFEFYKLNLDKFNLNHNVNYINNELSIAQDIWAPMQLEEKIEQQLYLYGISENTTEQEQRLLIKHKLGKQMNTPISKLNNYNKYDSNINFTSIAPINESYKEHFKNDASNKQLLLTSELSETQTNISSFMKVLETANPTKMNNYSYKQIYNAVCNNIPSDAETFNLNILDSSNSTQYYGTSLFTRLNNKLIKANNGKIYNKYNKLNKKHQINFIMMKESFKATENELKAAKELKSKKQLKPTNLDYLLQVEQLAPRLNGLHALTNSLVKEYSDIFAEHTYSRRTMKVAPARLGIIEKFRHITCFRAQYPLSVQKRLWMIEYTQENDINKYWTPVTRTLHCIPYLMIPKRNKDGKVIRYRPAFDARVVNQYLHLYPIHLPTMKDFDEIYSIKGLFTLMDMKNMFDCIPLHEADRPWSTVMTPMGIRRMDHLAYGFKNCPYFAQNIMNKLAMHVGLTLVYIDDIVMKHHWHWNAQQHIDHLRKIFDYIRNKNMLLNPSKFFPFVTKCTSFGIQRTFEGSSISDAYKQKIIELKKPTTAKEIREFQGTLNYVSRYLYNASMMQYWLNQLMIETPEKRGNLKWNKPALVAFEQLKFLAANAPILHNPTVDGEFMVKTDACMTGIGAVLYQQQTNSKTNQPEWVIVDMYHQMMPKQLRTAHSTVHEAYGVVKSLEHWQHYLMKREFTIYTDNRPVSIVFTGEFEGLNRITQEKLIRLRVALAPFTFQIKHVPGVQNVVADALSRETIKIIEKVYGKQYDKALLNNESLLFGAPVFSKDTRYKPRTQQQTDEINRRAAQVSKQINIVNQQLMDNNYFHYINNLVHNEQVASQDRFSNQIPTRVSNKRTLIDEQLNTSYELLLCNWEKHQPFCQQQQSKQLLSQAKYAVLTKDECATDDYMCSQMTAQLINCIQLTQNIKLPILTELANKQENAYDEVHQKLNILFENIKGKRPHCIHKQRYICNKCRRATKTKTKNTKTNQSMPIETTLENAKNKNQSKIKYSKRQIRKIKSKTKSNSKSVKFDKNNQTKTKMTLRSDSRKQHEKLAKRTQYLNEDFDDLSDRQLIRQEFIYNLYGHRTDKTLYQRRSFIERQKADTELNLIRSIIDRIDQKQCPINRQNIEEYDYFEAQKDAQLTKLQKYTNDIIIDFESIQYSNAQLAAHIIDGSLTIHNNALVYNQTIDNKNYKSLVVPGILKHKMMDHAHHNLHTHHPNWEQTYNNIKCDYWWTTMKMDIRRFVNRCLLCNFANGSLKNRAPLTTREPVLPRESLFGDYIELTLANKRMYILVLVDYCTGWCMLIPTKTNDAYTVVDAILRKWIPIHGTFKYFDSDQGSGFIGNVTKLLCLGLGTDLQFAEPGYHRGIGKVERTIRIIQDQFQRINLQWDEVITDCKDPDRVFNILRVISPHVQAALNQRRPRISTFSPNMLMFGTQLKDLSNIDIIIERMKNVFCDKIIQKHNKNETNKDDRKQKRKQKEKKNFFDSQQYLTNPLVTTITTNNSNNLQTNKSVVTTKNTVDLQNKNEKLENNQLSLRQNWRTAWKTRKTTKNNTKTKVNYKFEDYKYLKRLLEVLQSIYKSYSTDWHKYMYESCQQYNERYNINDNSIKRNNSIFKVGTQVLYFVGDKQVANKKWLRRFTGPWLINVRLSDGTVIIMDPKSKIQKRVSINRLKVFKSNEVNKYSNDFDESEYNEYNQQLKNILFKVSDSDRNTISQTSGTDLNYKNTRNSGVSVPNSRENNVTSGSSISNSNNNNKSKNEIKN